VKKVVTFGELMLRLSSPGFERLLQSPELKVSFGGGEANVAISLARFGLDSYYVTRLPPHALGDAAVRALHAEGVRSDYVVRGGSRMGLYFAETGADPRPSVVVYDRAHSAITEIEPKDVDWGLALRSAQWFHTSGITPALGPKPEACTRAALEAAKRAGVTVSLDVNYRRKLWSDEEAQRVLRPLVEFVDILVASEEDLESALGISLPQSLDLGADRQHRLAERVAQQFGIQMVAITRRHPAATGEHDWTAVLYERATSALFRSPRWAINPVDRIGAGDSFAAGLIYAVVTGRSAERALAFAVAASALKQTIPGDYNRVSVEEVDRLLRGVDTGEVQR
jgi:2-dehydro-3-deoxygluconokinase